MPQEQQETQQVLLLVVVVVVVCWEGCRLGCSFHPIWHRDCNKTTSSSSSSRQGVLLGY